MAEERDAIDELERRTEQALTGEGPERIAKQHQAGKMTARERLDLLFDEGSFTELDRFVTHRVSDFGMDKRKVAGDGVVTGFGRINGRTTFAFAQDFTVFGGALGEAYAGEGLQDHGPRRQERLLPSSVSTTPAARVFRKASPAWRATGISFCAT